MPLAANPRCISNIAATPLKNKSTIGKPVRCENWLIMSVFLVVLMAYYMVTVARATREQRA